VRRVEFDTPWEPWIIDSRAGIRAADGRSFEIVPSHKPGREARAATPEEAHELARLVADNANMLAWGGIWMKRK